MHACVWMRCCGRTLRRCAVLCCAVLCCAVQADKEIGAVKVSRLNMVDLAGSEKTTKVCGATSRNNVAT
jgi:hypothetical protein